MQKRTTSADVARAAGVSRATVSYVLNDIRIDNACALLRHTNLTLDAIAAQCGFHYTSYFIRAFHKHFACSPGVYRARQEPAPPEDGCPV